MWDLWLLCMHACLALKDVVARCSAANANGNRGPAAASHRALSHPRNHSLLVRSLRVGSPLYLLHFISYW